MPYYRNCEDCRAAGKPRGCLTASGRGNPHCQKCGTRDKGHKQGLCPGTIEWFERFGNQAPTGRQVPYGSPWYGRLDPQYLLKHRRSSGSANQRSSQILPLVCIWFLAKTERTSVKPLLFLLPRSANRRALISHPSPNRIHVWLPGRLTRRLRLLVIHP